MKKSTKSSLIIFIVIFVVGYVMACFIPDDVLAYATISGSLLSFLGDQVAKLIGMRAIIAIAIALVVVLLIRIVDTEDKDGQTKAKTAKNPAPKKTDKKENKWET